MTRRKRAYTWSLKKKLVFFFSWMLIITCVLIFLMFSFSTINRMTTQSKVTAREELKLLASNYEDTLEQYHDLAVALIVDDTMQDYIKYDGSGSEVYSRKAIIIYDFFLNMLNVQTNMNFVAAVKEDGEFVYKGNSSVTNTKFDKVYEKDYNKSIPVKEGSTVRISFGNRYFRDGKYTLTLYYPIYITSAIGKSAGMLVINLNDSMLEEIQKGDADSNTEWSLIDRTGSRLAVSDGAPGGKQIPYMDRIKGRSGSFQEKAGLINYQKIGKFDLYLVNEIPLTELYKEGYAAVPVLVLIALIINLVSVFVLRRMLDAFYEPVNRVVQGMDEVAKGRLDVRIDKERMDVDSRKLAEGFNAMMDEMDRLMEQIKTEQHQIEQIRFDALQSQIKPHFLYNTLECIHWQAVADGNEEISTMVKAMAKYYRICLSGGKEIIPLRQELEHIRSYLIIQNMRYDHIISLEIHIPEEYYEVEIPRLTLQPIVENAIYHGIRVREGKKGTVTLHVEEKHGDLFLYVADSGCGMRQEQIDEMNRSLSVYSEAFGYGVRNVSKRIELLFGEKYGIFFYKGEKNGVVVEIHIPMRKAEEKGEAYV